MSLHDLSKKASGDYDVAEIAKGTKTYSRDVLINMNIMIDEENGSVVFLMTDTPGNKCGERINSVANFCTIKPASVILLIFHDQLKTAHRRAYQFY